MEPEVPRGEEEGALQYSVKALLCAFTTSWSYRWQKRHQQEPQLGRGAGPVLSACHSRWPVAGRLSSPLQAEFGSPSAASLGVRPKGVVSGGGGLPGPSPAAAWLEW